MMKPAVYLAAFLIFVAAVSAKAEIILTATLTHDQETVQGTLLTSTTGDPRPLSFGEATFVLSDDQTSLTMNATIFNIDVTERRQPPIRMTTSSPLTFMHLPCQDPMLLLFGDFSGYRLTTLVPRT